MNRTARAIIVFQCLLLLVGIVVLGIVGCADPEIREVPILAGDTGANVEITAIWNLWSLYRFVDHDYGVVCYFLDDGLDCLPLESSAMEPGP